VSLKQLEVFFFNICLLGEGTVLYTRKIYMQITPVIHETLHYEVVKAGAIFPLTGALEATGRELKNAIEMIERFIGQLLFMDEF
jgi:hypothetical protein